MSQDQESYGSFPTGLVVGFLVGATGYFITKTKEGNKLKDEFKEHWFDLKDTLVAEGVISENESEITDYISALRHKVTEFLGEHANIENESQLKAKKSSKKSSKRSSRKKLFKGI